MSGVLPALGAAWRIAFLTAAAPVVGSVLLLAIARLTGARWQGLDGAARWAPLLIVGGALLGLAQAGVDLPPHLAHWASWWGMALRGAIAAALLAWAGARLRAGAGTTFAGVTLALYAASVTPIASDWMLGQVPGHSVSAIGMMFSVEAIAGIAALLLVTGQGSLPTRRDMAQLMAAAMLGLVYLAFMDYLIIWFGNLPSRVGFYLDRGTPAMTVLVSAALLVGLAAPIGLLALVGGERGRRGAGAAVLVGLLLFNGWWVAGGVLALLLGGALAALLGAGLIAAGLTGAGAGLGAWRRAAHG